MPTQPTQPIKRARERQRGVALIAAVVALGMVAVIAYDFSSTTSVSVTAAANQRDAMRAHFLARSSLNLSELVIRLQQRIDNVKELGGIQITDYADQLMLAFCGTNEEVMAAIGLQTDQLKGLGADIGTCGVSYFDTEDDKINLNCAGGNDTTAKTIKTRIDALMFFPAFDPVFQDATADGWRRDRELQATALMDYIDKDHSRFGAPGTTEEYGYESLKDDYRAKDNYVDSLGELRMIRGVDDRFWNLFGSAFTVYGNCKSNVGALKDPNLIASMIYLAAKDQADPVVQDPQKLWMLAGCVAKARQFGFYFATKDDFAEFVKDPAAAMGAATDKAEGAGAAPTSSASENPLAACGVPPGMKIGVVLDAEKLNQIATEGPRRTYRVEAYGAIDRKQTDAEGNPVFPTVRRTYKGVWDTKVTTQNGRPNAPKRGAWVFLKEE
jgi:type II secretory pathway component PulK